jgi:hypothetical protein
MRRTLLATALGLAILSGTASAQDAHYWTQKYGTRALLLGGTVIGSAVDLSTSFYNPAGQATLTNGGILTVKAFDFASFGLASGAGPGVTFTNSRSSILPTFFGGTVPIHFLGSNALGYSIFTRQQAQFDLTGRSGSVVDVFPTVPGNEPFAAEGRLEQDLNDTWVGVTWSRKLGGRWAVGLSQYVSVRSQSVRRGITGQSLASNGATANTTQISSFNYDQWGTLTKIGVMAHFDKVDLGATLTTPTLKFIFSGDALFDSFITGQDFTGDGIPDNQFIASYQSSLSGRYKTPLSIGGGAALRLKSNTLYASGEWFNSIPSYSVLEVAPSVDQATGAPAPLQVTTSAKSVFNFGGGLEHAFTERTKGFVSYTTDKSSLPGQQSQIAVSAWDINLIQAGVSFAVKKWEFTLGGGYGWGSAPTKNVPNFGNPSVNGGLITVSNGSDVKYQDIRIIFGFSI